MEVIEVDTISEVTGEETDIEMILEIALNTEAIEMTLEIVLIKEGIGMIFEIEKKEIEGTEMTPEIGVIGIGNFMKIREVGDIRVKVRVGQGNGIEFLFYYYV